MQEGASPDGRALSTVPIQRAINACAAAGGGVVRIPPGVFRSGTLRMHSGVTLRLDAGACLAGSADVRDYVTGSWTDALIHGEGLEHVAIDGQGTIDGGDCRFPGGEEGFRGPHGIRFINTRGLTISGITLQRTGNYAVFCTNTSDATIRGVSIRGGHDGLHAQACSDFVIEGSDFRTGDDAVAGCDNRNFHISNCKFNSSCNAFRFGCDGLKIEHCRIWGPGEYAHQVRNHVAVGTAFVHFSPADRNPQLPSDNWVIRDVQVDNVDHLYEYHHGKGLWQEGQPVRRIRFERVTATRLRRPFRIVGDAQRQLDITLHDVALWLDPQNNDSDQPVIDIRSFGRLEVDSVTLQVTASPHLGPLLRCVGGNALVLRKLTTLPADHPDPVQTTDVVTVHHAGPGLRRVGLGCRLAGRGEGGHPTLLTISTPLVCSIYGQASKASC